MQQAVSIDLATKYILETCTSTYQAVAMLRCIILIAATLMIFVEGESFPTLITSYHFQRLWCFSFSDVSCSILFFSGFPREEKGENELAKRSRFQNIRDYMRETRVKKNEEQGKEEKAKMKEKNGIRKTGGQKRKFKRDRNRSQKGKKSKAQKLKKGKRKGRNMKGKGQNQNARQETSNCKNLTCLNDLQEVLKIDKDAVQNFIQQNRRLKNRLELAGVSHSFLHFYLFSFID